MSAWRSYILGPNSGVVSNYWWVDWISFANRHWLLVVCQSSLRRITTRPDKEEGKGNDTQVSPDVPDQFLNGNTRQRAITPPTSDSWENGNKHQHGVAARTGQPRKNPISAEIDRRKSGWLATEGIYGCSSWIIQRQTTIIQRLPSIYQTNNEQSTQAFPFVDVCNHSSFNEKHRQKPEHWLWLCDIETPTKWEMPSEILTL